MADNSISHTREERERVAGICEEQTGVLDGILECQA